MRVSVTVGIPNEVELELGRQYAKLARHVAPGEPLEDVLARAFATHRQRCTEQVEAILYSVEMDGLTDDALNLWATVPKASGLVDAYRLLRRRVDEAAKLIPQVLSGARAR